MQHKCFEPIIFEDSKILILGSFPSLKSVENSFYYSHPKNQFWKILSNIYNLSTETKEQKIGLLKINKIALWDMAASCERINSADSNLKNIKLNNIALLLTEYQNINCIFFTGLTAQKLYKKEFSGLSIKTTLLPSPSPAYAAMNFDSKLSIWSNCLCV
jgi:hypoxanthine-DNA glycosylase